MTNSFKEVRLGLGQIANLVTVQGKDRPMVKNVMTLKSCSPIVGVDVMSFDSEKDVLLAWRVCTQDNTARILYSLIFCAIGFIRTFSVLYICLYCGYCVSLDSILAVGCLTRHTAVTYMLQLVSLGFQS